MNMGFVSFIRSTEYEAYKNFLERLKSERKILFVSSFKALNYVPAEYTGVYISNNNDTITVFVERNKIVSIKEKENIA